MRCTQLRNAQNGAVIMLELSRREGAKQLKDFPTTRDSQRRDCLYIYFLEDLPNAGGAEYIYIYFGAECDIGRISLSSMW